MNINKKDLAHLMKYVFVCKEIINFEGLRLIIFLRYLEGK